jgi:hypothetical protein
MNFIYPADYITEVVLQTETSLEIRINVTLDKAAEEWLEKFGASNNTKFIVQRNLYPTRQVICHLTYMLLSEVI